MKPSRKRHSAFTVVEVLAVIIVLAIFAFSLLRAFAKTSKTHTIAMRCLNNHAQLTKAWQMYAVDSEDYVANNYTIPGTLAAINNWKTNGVCDNWAPNVMTYTVAGGSVDSSTTTNTALAKAGLLGSYHQDIDAYHCPADYFVSRAQKAAGWKYRLRSVSMNSNWGRTDPGESKAGNPTSWAYGGVWRQWHRLAEVRKPADRYVFLDEHADSINDGFFIVSFGGGGSGEYPATSTGAQWGDVPGFYHNNGTAFGFADGHADVKRWWSRNLPVRGDFSTGVADIRDQQWYVRHVAERL